MSDALLIQTICIKEGSLDKYYAIIKVAYPEGSVCTCSDGVTTLTAEDASGYEVFWIPNAGIWTVTISDGTQSKNSDPIEVTAEGQCIDILLYYLPEIGTSLDECTWKDISDIASLGLAESYFSIGDCKAVPINGTIGTAAFDVTYYVYIIGFNHNGATNTIDFGSFKTADTDGVDICLIDDMYGKTSANTNTKYFNMNHYYNTNSGGWKSCDLRSDVLGSTNATTPVSNTLMAALPAELRAVMKPMTIYTDNTGGGTDTASYVTSSVDYLPLLAEFEISGVTASANTNEKNYQKQYSYYSVGNSKMKYTYNATNTSAYWWARSPAGNINEFCHVNAAGSAGAAKAYYSRGLAPIFRV